jgi:hypothetical protein
MQNVRKLTEKVLRPKLCHEVVCSSGIAREKDGIVPWVDPLPSFLPAKTLLLGPRRQRGLREKLSTIHSRRL